MQGGRKYGYLFDFLYRTKIQNDVAYAFFLLYHRVHSKALKFDGSSLKPKTQQHARQWVCDHRWGESCKNVGVNPEDAWQGHLCWCRVLRSSSQASSVLNWGWSLCSTGSVARCSPSKLACTTRLRRGLLGKFRPNKEGTGYCDVLEVLERHSWVHNYTTLFGHTVSRDQVINTGNMTITHLLRYKKVTNNSKWHSAVTVCFRAVISNLSSINLNRMLVVFIILTFQNGEDDQKLVYLRWHFGSAVLTL